MDTPSSTSFFKRRKNVINTVLTFFTAFLLFICILLGVGIILGWFGSKVASDKDKISESNSMRPLSLEEKIKQDLADYLSLPLDERKTKLCEELVIKVIKEPLDVLTEVFESHMKTHKDLTGDEHNTLYEIVDLFLGSPSVLVMIERYLREENNATKPNSLNYLLRDQKFSRVQRKAGVEEYRKKHMDLNKTTDDFLKIIAGETIEQSGTGVSLPGSLPFDLEDLLETADNTPSDVEAALKSFKASLTKSIDAMEPNSASVLLPLLGDELKPEDPPVPANRIRNAKLDEHFYPILKNLFDYRRLQIISPSNDDILLSRLKALWCTLQGIIDFNLQQISEESNRFDDVLRNLATDGEFNKEDAISFWTNAGPNSEKFKNHLCEIEEFAYDYKWAAKKARDRSPSFAKNQWTQIAQDKGLSINIGVHAFLNYKK